MRVLPPITVLLPIDMPARDDITTDESPHPFPILILPSLKH